MAIKYVEIVNGTSDARYPQDRTNAKAAALYVDSNDSYQLKHNANGSVVIHVDTTSSQVLSGKQVKGIAPVSLTAATLSLTAALHDGLYVIVNRAAGSTITLPAATGTGATFKIIVGTTLTSGSLIIQVANSTDYLRGEAYTFSGATASTFGTANTGTVATESDTLTMNRTTTGLGTQGDFVEIVDIAANLWGIEADYASSGTAATPFSAAV